MTIPSLDEAVYTFILGDAPHPGLTKRYDLWDGVLSLSQSTDYQAAQADERTVAIIGLCVDSHAQWTRDSVAQNLLDNTGSFDELLKVADRLAGRFALLYSEGAKKYALSDATSMLNIFYAKDCLCLASAEQLIADVLGLKVSPRSMRIRRASMDPAAAMPNDLTMFGEAMGFLLPNHYLSLPNRAVRYFPNREAIEDISVEDAVNRVAPLLVNIAREYSKYTQLMCALTAGYDSRIVYAYTKEAYPEVPCFTYKRKEAADYEIPNEIQKARGFEYHQIEEPPVPSEYEQALRERAGQWITAGSIKSAYAFDARFHGKSHLGGAIIDQIGRTSRGRGLPEFFARPSFFACLLRNFDADARRETIKWAKAARHVAGGFSLFDLFAWESRCGRWATQTGTIHALASVAYLNIFNCREIILAMASVPRKDRVKKRFHEALIKRVDPGLFEFPFNPHSVRESRLKNRGSYFLLAVYGGYIPRWIRYAAKNRKS